MNKHKQLWMAVIVLIFAGLACQSQEAAAPPAPELPPETKVESIEPLNAEPKAKAVEKQAAADEEQNIDIVSSIESHDVLSYSPEPLPTISPETGLSGAELLQLGTLPIVSSFNPPAGCEANTDADVEAAVLNLVNEERARYGLDALTLHYQLSAAAGVHTLDMACNNFFSHTGSDGSSPFDRIKAQGYDYAYAGENLFAGNGVFNDAAQAVAGWMKSPGHRQNILNPQFTEAGVSYIFNPNSKFGGYFALVLARP